MHGLSLIEHQHVVTTLLTLLQYLVLQIVVLSNRSKAVFNSGHLELLRHQGGLIDVMTLSLGLNLICLRPDHREDLTA